MKAVILAAGKGTRMGELGKEIPKALLEVSGKSLLHHKLDQMPDSIDEVVIVVGHLKEKIIEALGDRYKNLKITYLSLDRMIGTADALFACKDLLVREESFLVMNGDDLYCKEDMEKMAANPWAILVLKSKSVLEKGKVVFDGDGKIIDIIEKYKIDEPGSISIGMYALTPEIFNYKMVEIPGGEYGLPQTILSAKNDREINAVEATFWLQITRPEDLKIAEEYLNMKK